MKNTSNFRRSEPIFFLAVMSLVAAGVGCKHLEEANARDPEALQRQISEFRAKADFVHYRSEYYQRQGLEPAKAQDQALTDWQSERAAHR